MLLCNIFTQIIKARNRQTFINGVVPSNLVLAIRTYPRLRKWKQGTANKPTETRKCDFIFHNKYFIQQIIYNVKTAF